MANTRRVLLLMALAASVACSDGASGPTVSDAGAPPADAIASDAAAPDGATDGSTPDAPVAAAADPVVFVHGYMGKGSDFDTMIAAFIKAGYAPSRLRAITYADSSGSNVAQATELATFVDGVLAATGADRVDLVAHSAGGLSSRYWVKFLGGKDKVRDYVSLAGAHHGNSLAVLPTAGSQDLFPAYDETPAKVQFQLNGKVGAVPATDETPFGAEDGGRIHYNAFWSGADGVIVPSQSECLNQKSMNDCTDPVNTRADVAHNAMVTDASVTAQVIARVRLHDAGNP